MSPCDVGRLLEEVEPLAYQVGFASAHPDALILKNLPGQARAYVAPYAWLVLWPVESADEATLATADAALERHFLHAFPSESGRAGSVIDGYGVLALPEFPRSGLDMIRTLRLKRSVFRRCVVWWNTQESRWEDVGSITVLGIPGLGRLGAGRGMLSMTPEEQRLYEAANGASLVSEHIAEVSL
jgi:hypothetical protein